MLEKETTQETGAEKGRNVVVHNCFVRHGKSIPMPAVDKEGKFGVKEAGIPTINEKGEFIYDEAKMTMEKVLSPTGKKAATAFGEALPPLREEKSAAKVHSSAAVRARDTGKAVLEAMPVPPEKKYQTRIKKGLTNFHMSDAFRKRWEPNYKKTGDLDAAIQFILDHNDEDPENTRLRDVAAAFADRVDFSTNAAGRFKSGSEVAYINPTHGAMLEAYLQRVLITQDEQGNKKLGFKNVKEIGGAFVEATGYEVRTVTDKKGSKKVFCIIRGKEYEIDLKENQILADEWRVKEREEREKQRRERNK